MTFFVDCEMTDTFSGEPNYAWVRRAVIELPDTASDRQVVIAAKAALSITGVRCTRSERSDGVQLDLVGACVRVFITAQY